MKDVKSFKKNGTSVISFVKDVVSFVRSFIYYRYIICEGSYIICDYLYFSLSERRFQLVFYA